MSESGGWMLFLLFIMLCIIAWGFLHSPFHFPYFYGELDISGRKQPCNQDVMDEFLMQTAFHKLEVHETKIKLWHQESLRRISHSMFPVYRQKQYFRACDDDHAFRIYLMRKVTKYRQSHGHKYKYKVWHTIGWVGTSFDVLNRRNLLLAKISYECTLRKWLMEDQRSLMTQSLRKQIMERDNYTCQYCGKYMPSGKGIHIDHIVPIAKGGKTVPSNLQVLCADCNLHKSAN